MGAAPDGQCCGTIEDACCLPDGTCSLIEDACCLADGTCTMLVPLCCTEQGGTPMGDLSECDDDVDGDGVYELCGDECPNDPNKTEPGVCGCGVPDVDTDGDGILDCLDGCPNDPMKSIPMVCGCGVGPMDGFDIEQDTDADSIPDCVDVCPGEDDNANVNQNGVKDCLEDEFIPTVSEWGLVVLALLLLVGAKVWFSRRPRTA